MGCLNVCICRAPKSSAGYDITRLMIGEEEEEEEEE